MVLLNKVTDTKVEASKKLYGALGKVDTVDAVARLPLKQTVTLGHEQRRCREAGLTAAKARRGRMHKQAGRYERARRRRSGVEINGEFIDAARAPVGADQCGAAKALY